ncbi:Hypothetical predicted protein [Lynx pardinus]|uniref:Vomeronasal type-1 receptor n=1 Tax=Lynx pardinus TaxID=191816 RepID=A0A485MTC2_LYNPA|nr:Hypothetical predicted protein [Lynx pardinus]
MLCSLMCSQSGQSMSICVFQAIMISPGNSRQTELKVKAPKYIGPSTILCRVFRMFVNMFFSVYMTGKWNNKTITKRSGLVYSASQRRDKITGSLDAAMTSFHDILCLGHMTLPRNSMVFLLHRHKQRVQGIIRNNLSPRPSSDTVRPELPKASLFW